MTWTTLRIKTRRTRRNAASNQVDQDLLGEITHIFRCVRSSSTSRLTNVFVVVAGSLLPTWAQTEDSEQVEFEFVIYRRRIRRRRYRKTCNCPGPRTLTAPKPPKLIPKSRYGNSVWVHLLLEKFLLGRPMQRTIEQLRLYGLQLAAGTITDGMKRIEPLLEPIYAALRERNVQSAFHHADETRWLVFVEKQGKNSYRWWLWVFAGEDSVVYVLDPTRSHEVPEGHFPADAEGVLIVDRYSAYKAMKQVQEGKLILVFCWAHVRRDFVRSRKRLSGIEGVGADVAASDTRIVSAPPPAKTT